MSTTEENLLHGRVYCITTQGVEGKIYLLLHPKEGNYFSSVKQGFGILARMRAVFTMTKERTFCCI